MHGLLIKRPWIDLILAGEKTWELRGGSTTIRGKIALIQSGSGMVVGTCELTDVSGPLDHDQLLASTDRHCVDLEEIDASWPYKKTYAWILTNAQRLPEPIRYKHPHGAVIWVKLPDDIMDSA